MRKNNVNHHFTQCKSDSLIHIGVITMPTQNL
jgi:hypothetical protein